MLGAGHHYMDDLVKKRIQEVEEWLYKKVKLQQEPQTLTLSKSKQVLRPDNS